LDLTTARVSFDEFSKQGKEFVFSYKFAMGDNPIFGFSNLNVRKIEVVSDFKGCPHDWNHE